MEEIEMNAVDISVKAEKMIDAICELEEGCFEILLNNPGCDKHFFVGEIMGKYWSETVDIYGTDPKIICESVLKLWDTPYYDADSVQEHTFKEWAMMFSTIEKIECFIQTYKNK